MHLFGTINAHIHPHDPLQTHDRPLDPDTYNANGNRHEDLGERRFQIVHEL